jgi:hypothetical protein
VNKKRSATANSVGCLEMHDRLDEHSEATSMLQRLETAHIVMSLRGIEIHTIPITSLGKISLSLESLFPGKSGASDFFSAVNKRC